MKKYEVELRGLLTQEKYEELSKFFGEKGKFLYDKDRVLVCYPDPETGSLVEECKTDIRVRTTNGIPEIIIKQGEWGSHDESRRELSLVGKKGEFDKMIAVLAALGHKKGIWAVRKGKVFEYKEVEFSLVEVPNHSYYFEAEVMVDAEGDKNGAIDRINKICKELDLTTLSQQEFYNYINKLNTESNELFDFDSIEEDFFNKKFGI